ncbi:MAG TPA: long-chain-fatty-acid--CoA ligase [Anaerolineales bacterium]
MSKTTVGELYDFCSGSYGKHTAIKFKGTSYTYREVGENAYRLANAFLALGLQKGERVAFLMANCPEYIFTEYALAKIGAVRVPLAVLLTSEDHIYMMNHSEAVVLVYHEKLTARVQAMIPQLKTIKHFVCVASDPVNVPEGHHHLQTMMADYSLQLPPQEVTEDDLCGIYYTGGTTGRPKGVMLSHRAWVNAVMLEMLELSLGRDEVFAYMTPLTHAGGVLLLPILLRRGVCLIMESFTPAEFLEQTEKEKVTAAMFVPTMIYLLLDYPGAAKYDTRSLRNILYGSAPIAAERLKLAITRYGPIFSQYYGQTESPMILTALPKEEHVIDDPVRERQIFSSCGRPTLTTQIKLVDGTGQEVPTGEVGEIVARSSFMMDGYFKDPEKTAATIQDGWLHTGDMARQDAEGFLYIVDRAKDMIISGGFNIYPREVEDVLFEHEAVKQAAVIGVPDDKWGEAVKAIVVLHSNKKATEAELIQFVKERKGSVNAPKSVEFWDSIPLTNLGKLDKKKIREPYWRGRDRQI